MSFVKYRVKEVAADFGVTPKDIAEIVGKYFEKPRSNTQVLTDEQLNVVFDVITQKHQIASLEQVFAVAPQAKKPEPKKAEAPKPAAQPAQGSAPAANAAPAAQSADKAAKPQQEQRKRERRVVDTSAASSRRSDGSGSRSCRGAPARRRRAATAAPRAEECLFSSYLPALSS